MGNGISIYSTVKETFSTQTIPLDIFLENVRNGRWQDDALKIRIIQDKEEREKAKKKVPAVTIAGIFEERNDAGLKQHSGYIAIDIDDIKDIETTKAKFVDDHYCVAAFVSISGRGLCVLFRVSAEKHREAFQGLSQYIFEKYGEVCDPTSINVSRCRFVTWDPHIYINPGKPDKFTQYPKSKAPKKIDKVVYAPEDFKHVMDQLITHRVNICENYHEWVRIGFALAHQFGEAGRQYFHTISQYSTKYDPDKCDKQYRACLRQASGTVATISMFYYYCKNAGLEVISERTRKIIYSTYHGKKSGLSKEQITANLEKFEDISGAAEIVSQAFDQNIELQDGGFVEQLELYFRQTYEMRRNKISRHIEVNGVKLTKEDLNGMYLTAKKVFDKTPYDLVERMIYSPFVVEYNPLLDFFTSHADINETGHIERIVAAIDTPDHNYALTFTRKWMVGVVASIHGEHNPLMLVLSGSKQNTGKTQFFRRLLPEDLKPYYAESKLDAGKDDEILMCGKLIVMDDEMGGKSKKEEKRLKELTSKAIFSLREPYGRMNVDLLRLASLCGTTNDDEILNDWSGNRRILPIRVDGIDHTMYNEVDKVALWMEAYYLYKSGFDWELKRQDIEYLKNKTSEFETSIIEGELLDQFFRIPNTGEQATMLSASQIKTKIENITKQKTSLDRIGKELKRRGYEQKHIKIGNTTARRYLVIQIQEEHGIPQPWSPIAKEKKFDDLPF